MRPRPPGCAVMGFPTDNDGFDGTTKPRARLIYPRPDRLDPENEARLASLPPEIGQYPQRRPAGRCETNCWPMGGTNMLQTPLCREMGIEFAIFLVGMSWLAGPELAEV